MQFGVWDGEEIVRKWGLDDPKMGEYAQGYIATLYLGHLAGGGVQGGNPDASTIARGLNSIFEGLGAARASILHSGKPQGWGFRILKECLGPMQPQLRQLSENWEPLWTISELL